MSILKGGVTEGVLLASIPVIGYGIAYIFELGYFSYFEIPSEFIEIGVQQILTASIAVFSVLVTFFGLSKLLREAVNILPVWFSFLLTFNLMGIAFFLIISWSYKIPVTFVYELLGIPLFIVVFLWGFVWPIFTVKGDVSILEKINNHLNSIMIGGGFDVGDKKLPYFYFLLIFFGLIYIAGLNYARTKKQFIVVKDDKEYILLKKTSSSFLAAEFIRKHNTFLTSFKLIPIDKNNKGFTYEYIGFVKPELIGMNLTATWREIEELREKLKKQSDIGLQKENLEKRVTLLEIKHKLKVENTKSLDERLDIIENHIKENGEDRHNNRHKEEATDKKSSD